MKIILHISYILTILLGAQSSVNAQIEMSTFHTDKDVINNFSNPASFGNYAVTVNLPSVMAGYYNNSFKFKEVLIKEDNELKLHMEELIARVNQDGLIFQANASVETFGVNVQIGDLAVGVNHGVRVINQAFIPKSAIEFLWGGNAQFIDQTVDLGIRENLLSYQEFGLRLGYRFENKISVGLRAKMNYGMASYQTASSVASIYTDPEIYQLTATTDYTLQVGGLPELNDEDGALFHFENNGGMSTITGDNKGLAFDLGIVIPVNEKITLQASIQNIGKINWSSDSYAYKSKGEYLFEGLDLKPLLEEGEISTEQLLDSISNTFNFESSRSSFSTKLPSTFNVGAQYQIMENLAAGAFIYSQAFRGVSTSALGVHIQKSFGSTLSVGTQYALLSGGVHNLGFTGSLRLGPVNIFVNTDNVLPLFDPLNTQNFNVRVGVNLLFGNLKKREQKKRKDSKGVEDSMSGLDISK